MSVPPVNNTRVPEFKVLLVDDHEVVRSGLKTLIELEDDLVVGGEAETAAEAVHRVESDKPDLVLMDVRLPDGSGIEACREITARHPGVKVLILTSHADDYALVSAIKARASGYILKRVTAFHLISIMRRVLDGEVVFEHDWDSPATLLSRLSPQERLISTHIAEGLTNHEIADRMSLAEKTVKNYVSNVLMKLGMSRRSEVAAHVARVGPINESIMHDSLI